MVWEWSCTGGTIVVVLNMELEGGQSMGLLVWLVNVGATVLGKLRADGPVGG